MDEVILARHGESVFSLARTVNGDPATPCPLTLAGVEQARRLGDLLSMFALDLCVTTAFERTQETAAVALDGRTVPRLVVPGLNEGNYGTFEGGPLGTYLDWARGQTATSVPPGEGESRAQMAARFASGYREVLARPEQTVLVVGHSLPICYVLQAVEGERPSPVMPQVAYAEPHRLQAVDLERAVGLIEAWASDPTW